MSGKNKGAAFQALVLLALLVCLGVLIGRVRSALGGEDGTLPAGLSGVQAESGGDGYGPLVTPTPTDEPTPTPVPTAWPEFQPTRMDTSDQILSTAIRVGDTDVDSYQADERHIIDFGGPEDYAKQPGIFTFRGNNFRNSSAYGTAQLNAGVFGDYWTVAIGSMGGWGGSGWTGQALAMQWPTEVKQHMNMYDWAKSKEDMVEVIYATLAGRVYFIDLETGDQTRDSLYLGYPFKGAGSLDPRGYPLMYLGGGVAGDGTPRIMIVSLLTGEVLFTVGDNDSFAPRSWSAWDSAPLVDAETDQLIYPGENGVLYLMDLNTTYDEAGGTIDVDPDVTRFTYTSVTGKKFYYGMEDSAIAWRGHLFIADNGASYLCINLNTLEIEWRFDCLDDTNCTGVLEVDETGHPYLYMSTSFHLGWRSSYTAEIPVWKIDAVTGQEVWHHSYTCYSVADLSGGVQGSLSLGTGPLEGILYVSVARCPGGWDGMLVALDTETGEEVWTYHSESYSWSTPVCFYDTDGNGYVLYATAIDGELMLFNGKNGDLLDEFEFGCTVEATPIVWNNTVVLGTRGQQIYGITLG